MSNRRTIFWLTILIPILVAVSFFNVRWTINLQDKYQAVVEENKALKAVNLATVEPQKNRSMKYNNYPELMVHAMISSDGDIEIWHPIYSVKLGNIGDEFDGYGRHKGSIRIWEKQQWPYPGGRKTTLVMSGLLPGIFGSLKKSELKEVLFIAINKEGSFRVFLRDVDLKMAYQFWSKLLVYYPDYSAGY